MKPLSAIRTVSVWAAAFVVIAAAPVWAQTNYQPLKSFGAIDSGTQPHAALLVGRDGALYGTTQLGGAANRGTVFRLTCDGSNYTVLHSFAANPDGKHPVGGLVQGRDGALFGSTVYGGSNGVGTIFTLATNGGSYSVLHHFDVKSSGQYPYGRLVQDSNGVLYGTTSVTASDSRIGVVYRLNTTDSNYTVLHTFTTTEVLHPTGLILGRDGALYGGGQRSVGNSDAVFRLNVDGTGVQVWYNTAASGARARLNALCETSENILYGAACYAAKEVIYSVHPDGVDYRVEHTFVQDGVDGQHPETQLLQGQDGALYGTTVTGGPNGAGTIFKLNDGLYTILYHFKTNDVDGRYPADGLVQAGDGTLYGVTLRGGFSGDGTVFSINPDGTGYRQLRQFNSFSAEGQMPSGSPKPDTAGTALYGTTLRGGSGGYGTLFKIDADGANYSILRHFGGAMDGQWPSGELVCGRDSAWYGTTYTGGSSNCGTVFRIDGDGTGYAQIHSFAGPNDGDVPYDALAQDSGGVLYGTTAAGGSNNVGTVFKLNANGAGFAVLHTFQTNGLDAASPSGGLLLGRDGMLYGVAEGGGTNQGGAVFKLDANGNGFVILHHFRTNGVDGRIPVGRLMQADSGALYGMTLYGGTQGVGTIFTINPDGSNYGVIQNLSSSIASSQTSRRGGGGLFQTGVNTLFGLLFEGGVSNASGGLVFQIGLDGSAFQVLHGFATGAGDGFTPSGGMGQIDQSWYGVTELGGAFNDGSLFSLNSALAPRIGSQPQGWSVMAGRDVYFTVSVTGRPVSYQWCFNGTALPNETGPSLSLTAVGRHQAGSYSVVVSNAAGTAVSSNALLKVYVPQSLSVPQLLPNGALQFMAGYADGWPLTSNDLVRFQVQVSSNLVDWVSLDNALSCSNGTMVLKDSRMPVQTTRFYRVQESP